MLSKACLEELRGAKRGGFVMVGRPLRVGTGSLSSVCGVDVDGFVVVVDDEEEVLLCL